MKLDLNTYSEISESLTRNKSRSLLTGFGVFWGIFMLLFLLGGGKGLKQLFSTNFANFANNMVVVISNYTTKPYKGFSQSRYWSLNYSDVERLKAMVPELEVVTPEISKWGQKAERGEYSFNAVIKGLYPDYSLVEPPIIKYGRQLNEVDILQERKVCVIGNRVYTSLFPDGGDPCGEMIKVGPVYYQVVGVDLNAGNMSINGKADESVSIPLPVAQKVFKKGNTVDLICMLVKDGVQIQNIEEPVRNIMSRAHSFDPSDKPAVTFLNLEEIHSFVDNLFKGIDFLLLLVGIGTILAGAIGVSNIMMVTVKERTTEIGIRRAIGATPTDILSQIMLESVSLTVASGMLGIVFTVFLLNVLEVATKHQASFQIGFLEAILALLFLTVLGILAGLAPASRAMSIKPVDAMRDE